MSDLSLCHSRAGAAVKCDRGLIPMTTLAIEHICFVVAALLSQEPSRYWAEPLGGCLALLGASLLFSKSNLKCFL